MTTTTTSSTGNGKGLLPPSGTGRHTNARRRYDWPGYVARLQRFPGQWLMLTDDVDGRAITYARSGRQPDVAPLLDQIEFRTRNNVTVGPSKRGELWARYTPGQKADNGPAISDETIAKIRRDHRDTTLTVAALAKKYATSSSNVNMIVRGQRRGDAPGPIYGRDYTVRAAKR